MSFGNKKKTEKSNPPVAKVRVGLISASIWENANEKGSFYSVTFDRRYRDEKGDWHSSTGFNAHDLLALAKCADLAHTKILEAQDEDETEEE